MEEVILQIIINPEGKTDYLFEILKLLVNLIGVGCAAYLAFYLGLRKDRQRDKEIDSNKLKELENFIEHSLYNLLESTKNQIKHLTDFTAQFKNYDLDISPSLVDTNFDIYNFELFSRKDIYRLFIDSNNNNNNNNSSKSKALRDFNFVMKVTKKVNNDLQSNTKELFERQNKIIDKINLLTEKQISLRYSCTDENFITKYDEILKVFKSTNTSNLQIFVEEIDRPILELAKNFKQNNFIICMTTKIKTTMQIIDLRKKYLRIYNTLLSELKSSHILIQETLLFLNPNKSKFMISISQRRSIVNNFIGYGNPKSSLWIFGREEGAGWPDNDFEIITLLDTQVDQNGLFDSKESKGTYGNYNKLVKNIKPNLYQNRDFFVGNLLPFGRKGDNISPKEAEYFSFEGLRYSQLIDSIREERIKNLLNFFEKNNWQDKIILFCCGKEDYGILNELLNALNKDKNSFHKPNPDLNYEVDNTRKLFKLRHLSPNHFPQGELDKISIFISTNLKN